MTTEERVQAVADYGFTDRQARFLVLVMQHSGLCIKRQYGAFAGVKPGGEKCNAFFEKLVRRGFAVTSECIHNRARLYHVHHKLLYHAIGEPESKPVRRPDPPTPGARTSQTDIRRFCGWMWSGYGSRARSEPISIARCRELLGDEADSLSDVEVDEIRRHADALAHVIIDMYLEQRSTPE